MWDHRDLCVKPIRILKNGRKAMSVVRCRLMEIESVLQMPHYKDKSRVLFCHVINPNGYFCR